MSTTNTQAARTLTPPSFSESDIMQAVVELRTPKGAEQKQVNENSRVDEQQLFAAFTYLQLKEQNPNLASEFLSQFRDGIQSAVNAQQKNPHIIVDVTRNILKGLRKTKAITRKLFKKIRRVSLGLSQLDSIRNSLNTDRTENNKGSDTPLRAFKTAFKKIAENPMASLRELRSFVANNRARTIQPNEATQEQAEDPNAL